MPTAADVVVAELRSADDAPTGYDHAISPNFEKRSKTPNSNELKLQKEPYLLDMYRFEFFFDFRLIVENLGLRKKLCACVR
jgi:hypothetical protein